MRESIHNQVVRKIKAKKVGAIVVPADFAELGRPDAVKMALSRLAKEGMIVRVAQGIYHYPKTDRELGMLMPSVEAIAQKVSQRDRARIMPSKADSLNRIGLSTQVPMKLVYLTNGSPRKLKIGKRTITFKKISPKLLAMKGKVSILAVQALQALGKDNITEEVRQVIAVAIKNENQQLLQHDLNLAPAWVAKVIRATIGTQ